MTSMMITTVGSINERGYLKGFKRRGYTQQKCLLELVANSLDSIDRRASGEGVIRFNIGVTEIQISDRNSEGMDRTAIDNMFDMHRENHSSDASRGVSGIGAKPALSNLSQDRNMHLLTHMAGGEYLRVDIPWANIHREGRYTGMVTIRGMTAEEAAAVGSDSGTTLVFPYSDELRDLILHNFEPYNEQSSVSGPLDRIGVVFGRERVKFECKHHEEPAARDMQLYNYFGGSDADFYKGKSVETIEHWYSSANGGSDRFRWNGLEIQRAGRGWGKEPQAASSNMHGFVQVRSYAVHTGLRRDIAIFDPLAPVLPTADHKHWNSYNTDHLGDKNLKFLASSKLVRNGQTIGLIPLADTNIADARAGGKAHLTIQLLQCEVRFNPVSTQDNRQDMIMGIQENKNQFDGENLPVQFTRLVKAIRAKKANEIWDYITNTVAAAVSIPAPTTFDSDSETDSIPPASHAEDTVSDLPASPSVSPPASPSVSPPEFPSVSLPEFPPAPESPIPNGAIFRERLQQFLEKVTVNSVISEEMFAQLAYWNSVLP